MVIRTYEEVGGWAAGRPGERLRSLCSRAAPRCAALRSRPPLPPPAAAAARPQAAAHLRSACRVRCRRSDAVHARCWRRQRSARTHPKLTSRLAFLIPNPTPQERAFIEQTGLVKYTIKQVGDCVHVWLMCVVSLCEVTPHNLKLNSRLAAQLHD